jgi:hypothetical protein
MTAIFERILAVTWEGRNYTFLRNVLHFGQSLRNTLFLRGLRLAVFFVAIFYMNVNIIGRSSGRSATGAAAYRSGEKLRSNAVKSAAYGSGSKLHSGEIVHDYTKKKGVMHSEIILPDNAPPEYADRETLWNVVEISEKRKDAQLAREIIVALPREFDLSEHIEVTREYVKENFVTKGMIADFAIHHTRKENPHAHIMLTTRHVTPEGFGSKNREWNSRQNLLDWREDWAAKNNRMFECKGFTERIDHRTLKAQGIDREPTIHMGAAATALERRGIATERGDYNREITRRNLERATNIDSPTKESELTQQHKTLEPAKIQPRMDAIDDEYYKFDKELQNLENRCVKIRRDIQPLCTFLETIEEYDENIRRKQKKIEPMRENRQKARFWEFEEKSYWDLQIRIAEIDLENTRKYFTRKFNMAPEQARAEIDRVQKVIREKEREIAENEARMDKIYDRQDALKKEYQALKLQKDSRVDRALVKAHADYWIKELERQDREELERQIQEEIIYRLSIISEEDFQKALESLSYEEAQVLLEIHETAKAEGLIKERRRNRTRTIGRSR